MERTVEHEPVVVLLPGLWMPAWVMLPLALRLRARGHRCLRFGYASARASLELNAERLAAFIRQHETGAVHFVGHSLGGVLALHTALHHLQSTVRRIVMMGSPYGDSYTARRLAERGWGARILGRTVPQWLACEKPAAPAHLEVGVIAGTVARGLGTVVAPDLPRPHDGVVRVAETRVPGMTSYIEVRASHAGMLFSAEVARLVDAFLGSGQFTVERPSDANEAPDLLRDERK